MFPLTCTKHLLTANESQFIHTKHLLNVLLADCQGGLEIFKQNDPFYQMLQVLVRPLVPVCNYAVSAVKGERNLSRSWSTSFQSSSLGGLTLAWDFSLSRRYRGALYRQLGL